MSEKPLSYDPTRAGIEATPLEFEETEVYFHKASPHVSSWDQGQARAEAVRVAEFSHQLDSEKVLTPAEIVEESGRLLETVRRNFELAA